jgi:hypothetical protein
MSTRYNNGSHYENHQEGAVTTAGQGFAAFGHAEIEA